jgi:hypothetical protein
MSYPDDEPLLTLQQVGCSRLHRAASLSALRVNFRFRDDLWITMMVSPGTTGFRNFRSCARYIVPGPGSFVPSTADTNAAVHMPCATTWP